MELFIRPPAELELIKLTKVIKHTRRSRTRKQDPFVGSPKLERLFHKSSRAALHKTNPCTRSGREHQHNNWKLTLAWILRIRIPSRAMLRMLSAKTFGMN